jgi:hypothetical protein
LKLPHCTTPYDANKTPHTTHSVADSHYKSGHCSQKNLVCRDLGLVETRRDPKKKKTHVKWKKASPKSKDNINTFISRNCARGMKTITE